MEEIINIINDINYDEMSCGCGLEDNKITNRYEAMRYGWDLAIEAVKESIKENIK